MRWEMLSISEQLINLPLPHTLWQELERAALLQAQGVLAMETKHDYNVDFSTLCRSWRVEGSSCQQPPAVRKGKD